MLRGGELGIVRCVRSDFFRFQIISMKLNPYLQVIIATILFSTNGVFVKILDLPATSTIFFRSAIPVILIFIYLKLKKEKIFDIDHKVLIFFTSFIIAIKTILFLFGVVLIPLSTAIVVTYTWPFFTAIFGFLILQEEIYKRNIYLLFIAFLGVVLIFLNQEISLGNSEFIGLLCMIGAAILHALAIVILKKESDNNSRSKMIFYQNFLGALMFLPFIFINQPYPSIAQFSLGVLYGALVGVVGYFFFFAALKKIKASLVAHFAYSEVLWVVLLGIIFFKEVLTWNIILGGILIIISAIFLKRE